MTRWAGAGSSGALDGGRDMGRHAPVRGAMVGVARDRDKGHFSNFVNTENFIMMFVPASRKTLYKYIATKIMKKY